VVPWEIKIKVGTGKLLLPERPTEFVIRAMRRLSLQALDITHLHALELDALANQHRDPFDRILIAQARLARVTVLTDDLAFQRYDVKQLYCGR
jgi:PIN domain nuclease of toxin-antitoxin system